MTAARSIDQFDFLEQIGEGQYGKVKFILEDQQDRTAWLKTCVPLFR